jgi:PAS domain S-box-containing protein
VSLAASRPVRLLRLLARTAAASNEAARGEDALARVLADTCELLGWEVGHAWLLAGDGSAEFVPTGVWHPAAPAPRFERLRLATAALRIGSSDGWVGALLARPSPIWAIAEPETDAPSRLRLAGGERVEVGRLSRTRVPLALECGLRSFLLIPIRARDEVVGALELASARRELVDAELLEALEHVGIQLGRAIERERAARELRSREEHLRAILGALIDTPVVVVDRKAGIIESFGSVRGRHGLSRETILGAPVSAWLRAEQLVPLRAALAAVYATGQPQRLEPRLDLPAGEAWFDLRLYPLHDASGAVKHVLCLPYDLTEQKRLERALRESERRYLTLADSAPVGIFQVDTEGNTLYENARLCEIAGVTREESKAGLWRERLHPDSAEGQAEAQRAMEQGRGFSVMVCYEHRDGARRWALAQGAPHRDDGGRLLGFVGTLTDVTEGRRAAEELARHRDRLGELVAERTAELERTHERLRRAERLAGVGTFAAGIAHQINNPVGAILVAAQFAQERVDEPAVVGMALDHIVSDARRCRSIVRGVLEFARGDVEERKPCDLNRIARAVCEQMLPDAIQRCASIELELAASLPPIVASAPALDQVLVNLVTNALEAGARRVLLRSAACPEEVAIEVHDDGRGIAPEHLEQVMDPFFTTRWESGGSGLGLSLAWGIVRGHGGDLELASEPGRGTTVRLRLPIAGEGSP